MDQDIFISYAKEDTSAANIICSNLENHNLRCWIAPRDIAPGEKYASAVIHAIENAKVVVIVFSRSSDQSANVKIEIEQGFNQGKIIIPFRIENIEPSDEVQYFIGSRQWLDAFSGPLDGYVSQLAEIIKKHLMTDSDYRGQNQSDFLKNKQYIHPDNNLFQQNNENVKISPLSSRALAYAVDLGIEISFIFVFLVFIIAAMQVILGMDSYHNLMSLADKSTTSVFGNLLMAFTVLLGTILYMALFDFSESRKSPGKKLLSLKIYKYAPLPKSKTWRINRALIKNLPLILIMLGYLNLGYIVLAFGLALQTIWGVSIFFSPQSQTIHDLVAGTTVISDKHN
jgi:uncharacterized RDD family membrane protein YckC